MPAQRSTHTQAVTVVSGEEEGDGSLNTEFATVPISMFPKPALGQVSHSPP